jgi:hypothetical protein
VGNIKPIQQNLFYFNLAQLYNDFLLAFT